MKRFHKNSHPLYIVLFTAVIISFLFKLFIGFDPDEQYAYSMMYRLSSGDQYLRDLFDAYQFSAFFASPAYQFAEFLHAKLSWNPVILFRMFSVVISSLLNLRTAFFIFEKTKSRFLALLGWMAMITALPKSILTLEHSNLAFIFLSWSIIDFLSLKIRSFSGILLGIDLSLLSLVYPPLVLLYVPLIILLFIHHKKAILPVVAVSFLILLITILPVLSSAGFKGLLHSIQMVLLDGSHIQTIADRIKALISDGIHLSKYIAIYSVIFAVLYVVCRLFQIRNVSFEAAAVCIPFVFAVFQFVLLSTSPMAGNCRYLLLMAYSFFLSIHYHLEKKYSFAISLALFAFVIIFSTSNTNLVNASGYMMFSPILYCIIQNERHEYSFSMSFLTLVLISQCITMIFTYRTWGTTAHHISHLNLAEDTEVLNGMRYRDPAYYFFQDLSALKEQINGDSVIVSSIYPYSYNILQKNVCAPVTPATLVYNEQWAVYLEECTDETIDVLVIKDSDGPIDSSELFAILENKYENTETLSFDTFTLYRFIRKKPSLLKRKRLLLIPVLNRKRYRLDS